MFARWSHFRFVLPSRKQHREKIHACSCKTLRRSSAGGTLPKSVSSASVRKPKEVRIDDRTVHQWRYDGQTHSVILTVPDAFKNWAVTLAL